MRLPGAQQRTDGEVAIRVDGLWKEYILGGAERRNTTFREMVTDAATAPFRKLRRLGGAAAEEERFWALRDVSFEIPRGEVVGIIGRNGAGKSTLLKILSKITAPTRGRVELRGRVASLLEVGTGFHPELTGRENIFLNGAILGMSRREIQGKFDEIVAFAEIEKFLDTPVKRYSSGMYVRLAFSVAAHLESEILLVDEVLAVGDADFQKRCLGKMDSLADGGRTVIFVSHQLQSVARLCDRAILVEHGAKRAEGKSADMISLYRGSSTANAIHRALRCKPGIAAQFSEIKIANVDMEVSRQLALSLDEPLLVQVKLKVEEAIGEATVSLALMAPDGTVVLATNSANQGLVLNFTGRGEHSILIQLPGQRLLNNDLVCRVALWTKRQGVIDEYETEPLGFIPRVPLSFPVKPSGFVNHGATWSSQAEGK